MELARTPDDQVLSVSAHEASLAARQEAADGVESGGVCEACSMLRLISFRTGQPSYEPVYEVSLDER